MHSSMSQQQHPEKKFNEPPGIDQEKRRELVPKTPLTKKRNWYKQDTVMIKSISREVH